MRTLTIIEMNTIAGAVSTTENITYIASTASSVQSSAASNGRFESLDAAIKSGTAIGGSIGAVTGAGVSTAETLALTAARTGVFGAAGAGVGTAGWVGYQVGEFINEHTPIQEWIANGLEKVAPTGPR